MKLYIFAFLFAAVVFVECHHTFFGTNVLRPLVFHKEVSYGSKAFSKRIEYFNYTLPYGHYGSSIQGLLAYDMTRSGASANITNGGVGYNHVNIRMKSDRAMPLHYDIYIYA